MLKKYLLLFGSLVTLFQSLFIFDFYTVNIQMLGISIGLFISYWALTLLFIGVLLHIFDMKTKFKYVVAVLLSVVFLVAFTGHTRDNFDLFLSMIMIFYVISTYVFLYFYYKFREDYTFFAFSGFGLLFFFWIRTIYIIEISFSPIILSNVGMSMIAIYSIIGLVKNKYVKA